MKPFFITMETIARSGMKPFVRWGFGFSEILRFDNYLKVVKFKIEKMQPFIISQSNK
jgi:hypothetical protein